jgi:hypothetical protein
MDTVEGAKDQDTFGQRQAFFGDFFAVAGM